MSRTAKNAKKSKKNALSYILVLLFSTLFIILGSFITDNHLSYTDDELAPIRTKVVSIVSDNTYSYYNDLGDEINNWQVVFEAFV